MAERRTCEPWRWPLATLHQCNQPALPPPSAALLYNLTVGSLPIDAEHPVAHLGRLIDEGCPISPTGYTLLTGGIIRYLTPMIEVVASNPRPGPRQSADTPTGTRQHTDGGSACSPRRTVGGTSRGRPASFPADRGPVGPYLSLAELAPRARRLVQLPMPPTRLGSLGIPRLLIPADSRVSCHVPGCEREQNRLVGLFDDLPLPLSRPSRPPKSGGQVPAAPTLVSPLSRQVRVRTFSGTTTFWKDSHPPVQRRPPIAS
jgi:hypothetical protein